MTKPSSSSEQSDSFSAEKRSHWSVRNSPPRPAWKYTSNLDKITTDAPFQSSRATASSSVGSVQLPREGQERKCSKENLQPHTQNQDLAYETEREPVMESNAARTPSAPYLDASRTVLWKAVREEKTVRPRMMWSTLM